MNRDGDISLKDVVKLQRYIAKLEKLNISEKMVVSKLYYGNIDMTAVTDMQKYIAQLLEFSYETSIYIAQNDAIEIALLGRYGGYNHTYIMAANQIGVILEDVLNDYYRVDLPSYD